MDVTVREAMFCGPERREGSMSRRSEAQLAVRDVLGGILLPGLHARSVIHVRLDIFSTDGDVLPDCINAAVLALVHAGIPIRDFAIACNACMLKDALADATRDEESAAPLSGVIAITPRDGAVAFASTSGRSSQEDAVKVLDAAAEGAKSLARILSAAVTEHVIAMGDDNSPA